MKADIDATVEYPHPPEAVWAALTSSDALAAWFMPNDFAAEAGRALGECRFSDAELSSALAHLLGEVQVAESQRETA